MKPTTLVLSMLTACSGVFIGTSAFAQNTGGVFPPVVNENHRSIQYRAAYNPDTDAFAQRLHYQQSIDDSLMWRIIGQTRKTSDSDADFDFVQAELFWEMTPNDAKWRRGVRFDARVRSDNRPGFLGFNGMTQTQITETLEIRALFLTSVELGENARDGVFIQTRAHLAKSLPSKRRIGIELFNSYGSTAEFEKFDNQSHSAGPFLTTPLGDGFNLFGGALFGITDGAPDTDLRLWITKNL